VGENLPIVLIEIVLVFGGALAFGWWQLRSIEKDREAARRQREREREAAAAPAPHQDTSAR
jgi:predicted negative regulator of RcsB-dependent stress response